jgi:ABC transporter substrate binding protein
LPCPLLAQSRHRLVSHALACSLATTVRAESFAKRVDIGGGRMMYIECHGSGSPTVLLISGTDTASDLWHAADQKGPTVYDEIQKTTRVCAYDRPGAPHLDQTFSRSDPVPQPTSPQQGVDDLVVASLNRPGGNITGVSNLNAVIEAKRLGLLRDVKPGITTVGTLLNPDSVTAATQRADIEEAARTIGLKVEFLEAKNNSELDAAFKSIVEHRIPALLVPADAFFAAARDRLAELAALNRVPAIYSLREFVVSGGVMSYGNDLPDTYRLVGNYAARIVKGASLPICRCYSQQNSNLYSIAKRQRHWN